MVISAGWFGKLKTAVQVAMVMVLIAVQGRPVWVDLLVYITVLITVLSGADYFFGVSRRRFEPGPEASDPAASQDVPSSQARRLV